MNQIGGPEQFRLLSLENQARYLAINRQMAGFARDHTVPIIFAPPLSIGGKINGASGCVQRIGPDALLFTASHVLGGYEERLHNGERLNWQVGNLSPFDPIPLTETGRPLLGPIRLRPALRRTAFALPIRCLHSWRACSYADIPSPNS